MHFIHDFVVFLTLLASIRLDGMCFDLEQAPPPEKAKATVTAGESRLFSGENVQMTCSVPDDPDADWTYTWFYENTLLSSAKVYNLNNALVTQSGDYSCQGEKTITSWPYIVSANRSEPLNIYVDGGWVLLRTPYEPLIIEETMTLTCRIRGSPLASDVIFYKGEEEIKKQNNNDLVLSNLKLEDNDMYSCRATWYKNMEYQSAQSLPSAVKVLDKLETPRLEIQKGRPLKRSGDEVVFKCLSKVNAREQGLSIEYYYLKDDVRLGPASGKDTYTISQLIEEDAGSYTCKVRVRALNVERWSNELKLNVLPPLDI